MDQIAGIVDLPHIGLFLREVLDGVGLEVLDPLYTGEPVLVALHVELHDLLYNVEKLTVGAVDKLHTDAESILPMDLLQYDPFFSRPQDRGRVRAVKAVRQRAGGRNEAAPSLSCGLLHPMRPAGEA